MKDELPTEQDKYEQPEIDRNDLRDILLQSLDEEDTVIWDRQVVTINKIGNCYNLQFRHRESASADFVIVANWGMSAIKNQITNVVPEYTGSFVIQGEILNPDNKCPNYKKLCVEGNLVVFGENKILSSQTKRNGSIVFYVY
ncbi:MAG: hypothetical protein WKG06_29380 [Segetibacter sp.]